MIVDFSHLYHKDSDLADITLVDFYKHENALRKGLSDFMSNLFADYAKDRLFYLSFYNLSSVEK